MSSRRRPTCRRSARAGGYLRDPEGQLGRLRAADRGGAPEAASTATLSGNTCAPGSGWMMVPEVFAAAGAAVVAPASAASGAAARATTATTIQITPRVIGFVRTASGADVRATPPEPATSLEARVLQRRPEGQFLRLPGGLPGAVWRFGVWGEAGFSSGFAPRARRDRHRARRGGGRADARALRRLALSRPGAGDRERQHDRIAFDADPGLTPRRCGGP
jgi:hypothetical protein